MNPESFLILHKVRGEPAFDIAIELSPGVWIIPTSGHRAYPSLTWSLRSLIHFGLEGAILTMPPDLPDHYSVNDIVAPVAEKPRSAADLMELLK